MQQHGRRDQLGVAADALDPDEIARPQSEELKQVGGPPKSRLIRNTALSDLAAEIKKIEQEHANQSRH